MSEEPNSEILDVAIAGGGVSGIYSGWRILNENKDQNVQLFEMGNRIGGRLLSLVPPGVENAHVEIGGMRFTDAHVLVKGLVTKLGLKYSPLPAGKDQNLAYLRGTRLTQGDLSESTLIPYEIENPEERENLGNLTALSALRTFKKAFKTVLGKDVETLEDLGKITEEEWKKTGEKGDFEGVPLTNTPMRYMMLRSLGHEAFKFAEHSSGYDSILYTWNGADGFPWNLADFGKSIEYHHVEEGYDMVPSQLELHFKALGGQIHLHTGLRNFEDVPLEDGTKGIRFTTRDCDGNQKSHVARKLILAMPRRSLELLDQTGPLLDPKETEVRKLIESVTPIPLFKLAVCYKEPWWEKAVGADSSGKSVTDLPIRQCYYWKVNPENNHGVILIYDDGLDLKYWENLRDITDPTGCEEHFEHSPEVVAFVNDLQKMDMDNPGQSKWLDYPAPKRMVDEIHRQICELHDRKVEDVPAPYAAAYRDWGEDPYGGGANFWHVNVRSYDVEKAIIQPKADVPAYICGECWSHGQGWVEGALATAEMMLQDHLGLEKPDWVAKPPESNA